jgi:hypothetical protein
MNLGVVLAQIAVRFVKIELTAHYLAGKAPGLPLNKTDSGIPQAPLASSVKNHSTARFALQTDQRFRSIARVRRIDGTDSFDRSQNDTAKSG